jgi:hypothetical protein
MKEGNHRPCKKISLNYDVLDPYLILMMKAILMVQEAIIKMKKS